MGKERLFWADVVRTTAIFFVVAGHSAQLNFSFGIPNVVNLLFFALYKTGVPMFVMLSGALLLNRRKEGYFNFYKHRLGRYFLPWMFWSLVTAIALNFNDKYLHLSFFSNFKTAVLSFWFLPMLTLLYLLTPFIRKLVHNLSFTEITFLLLIWFLAVSLLPFTINSPAFPLYIDNSLLTQTIRFSGYYVFGYYLSKYNVSNNIRTIIALCIMGLFYILFLTFKNNSGELYFNYNSPGVILISVGVFVLIKNISEKFKSIQEGIVNKYIIFLSEVSFGIYLVHLLVMNNILSKFGFPFPFKNIPIQSLLNGLCLFTCSLVAIYLLGYILKLKRIVT